ncbi:MAG: tetratricopeptide repeat protein [Thermoplasmata archaeon]|nr:tetratricopeptide repeat protein [Thermoplasmata archaeon]
MLESAIQITYSNIQYIDLYTEALLWKGKALIRTGASEEARESLEEALRVSKDLMDPILHGKILMALSFVSDRDIDNALEAAAIFEEEGDVYDLAEAKNYVGRLFYKRGQHDDALEHWNEGIDIGRSSGNFRLKAVMEYNVASILTQRGEFERSRELLRESAKTFWRVHFRSGWIYSYVGYGDMYLHRREFEVAERFLRRGESMAIEYGDEKGLELVRQELARLGDMRKG